jgi:formylglycine-generating enzyme required for sulfatase activity
MVVARYEVTQAEFKQALGHDPSFHAGCPKCPVEGVTHHEALAYCNHLSATETLGKCYSCSGVGEALRCSAVAEPQSCSGYRLPTEAEWELIARAGSGSATPGGAILSCMAGDEVASSIGWYKSNSEGLTHPVGSRAPNAWGVYDMSGNAYEWTADWYAPTLAGGKDPTGPESGTLRVLRGGSWYHNAHHLRSAKRMGVPPERRLSYAGFRCVRTLDDATTVGD